MLLNQGGVARICTGAVRYHPKFAYHDTIVLVSQYTLGIDTLHDMAYTTRDQANAPVKFGHLYII